MISFQGSIGGGPSSDLILATGPPYLDGNAAHADPANNLEFSMTALGGTNFGKTYDMSRLDLVAHTHNVDFKTITGGNFKGANIPSDHDYSYGSLYNAKKNIVMNTRTQEVYLLNVTLSKYAGMAARAFFSNFSTGQALQVIRKPRYVR